MSEAATTLLAQVLALSDDERALIADRLWDSLSAEARDEPTDDPTDDPAFRAELDRRLAEVSEHPDRLLDGPTVMAELHEHLKRKRGP